MGGSATNGSCAGAPGVAVETLALADIARTESAAAGRATAPSDAAVLIEHAAVIERICRSQLSSAADVEDAIQDTCVRFLTRSTREVINPEAWLVTAARRACQDLVRRRVRRREDDIPDQLADRGGQRVDDSVTTATLLRSLLVSLSPRDSRLLARLYLGGWTCEEVARELRVPAVHVRMMAVRARRHARRACERIGVEPGAFGLFPWVADALRRLYRRVPALRTRASGIARSVLAKLSETLAPGCVLGDCVVAIVAAGLVGVAGSTAANISGGAVARHTDTSAIAGAQASPPGGPTGRNSAAGVGRDAGVSATPARAPSVPVATLNRAIGANQNPQPEDVGFYSFTPSPQYSRDHTVYASGQQVVGCAGPCPILFVTTDRGASWQHLATPGFGGGQILLPSTYPADGAVFAIGASGLQRATSGVGGLTFTTVVPSVTQAAMQPGTAVGQEKIVLATVPLTLYDEATSLLGEGPTLPAGVVSVTAVAYSTDGQRILVAGEQLDPTAAGQIDGVLVTCIAAQCSTTATYPGQAPSLLVVSPREIADHTIAAVLGSSLVISTDDGASFRTTRLPRTDDPLALSLSPWGRASTNMIVAAAGPGNAMSLLRTADAGLSFSALAFPDLPGSALITTVASLPDGSLLVGAATPGPVATFGIRCSTDAGAHWRTGCS
jgi:RNA polymerase sigma factor (sigma-70 family)